MYDLFHIGLLAPDMESSVLVNETCKANGRIIEFYGSHIINRYRSFKGLPSKLAVRNAVRPESQFQLFSSVYHTLNSTHENSVQLVPAEEMDKL